MKFGPGMFFGGSRTLSFCRAMCGTKAKRFDGSVRIACAPGAVFCRSSAGRRRLAAGRELAGAGVDAEAHDLVVFLQAHVQHVWHIVLLCLGPRALPLDHTHPEHGLAADVDVVLAYEGELAIVADAEDRQTGRECTDRVAVPHVHWKIVLGHEHASAWIDVERAWMDGAGLGVLDRARLAGRLI